MRALTVQRGVTMPEQALMKRGSFVETVASSSLKDTKISTKQTIRRKKGHKQVKEEREITLVCNTKYNEALRPPTKRVKFLDDVSQQSPSPSKVRNIVGLFEGEREVIAGMPEEPQAFVYIKLSDIRYDRADLFDNVPVFNYPLIGFNEHARRNKLWQMIRRAIFTPFPEEKRHFLRLIEASQEMMYNESERQKEEDFPGYVRSRCHNFPFYYIKMTQGQYELL